MSKLVSLSDVAYKTLSRMKGKDMSFSDVILKLVSTASPKRNFLKFAGSMQSQSVELERFKRQIKSDRERNTETV
ncbi:MAG: antitoxin VapB family protein [Candidatus Micrarchaeota archaeon]|nr:antitoxin VapB family protein [Candidatus Micrarchaeota archaeon]